jgi:hypothetical protein
MQTPLLVANIERRVFELSGNVIRMDQTKEVKNIFEGKPEDRREVRSPKIKMARRYRK